MTPKHILVAGAGLAGLSAARALESRGGHSEVHPNVTVIDARDRVGGRVVTIRDGFVGGQHAEGGADIIESGQDEVIKLAKELRLTLVPILKDGFGFYSETAKGRPTLRPGSRQIGELFAPFYGAVRDYALLEGRWDSPIATALGRESVAEYLVRALPRNAASAETINRMRGLRGFFLADPEDLSMLAMVDFLATDGFGGDGGSFRVKGGNDRLATGLAGRLRKKVRLRTILRRVAHNEDRPLLSGDREQRIRQLLQQRRAAYSAIAHQVETTGRTFAQLVAQVEEVVAAHAEVPDMTRITVRNPEGSYHLCIGDGLLSQAGQLLCNRQLRPGPVAIVTNPMIAEHPHAATLMRSLGDAGYEAHLCLVPEGEQHKTLATVATLYDQFLTAKLDRRSAVIALGGGVVGDMAGFAAASYLRGVPFVQMPTSLLAMVDASVGGKTGVDLPQGKNLVGAFKQPHLVVLDTATLQTLPAAEFRSGLAEVIKHGVIGAPELFRQFEEEVSTSLAHLVADAVRVKVEVVEEDPYEQGRRATLNLGHTFGHALEQVSNFSIRHGEGVAVGMVAAANMAVAMGRCDATLATRIRAVLERAGLPVQLSGYEPDAVLRAMGHDKKRSGKTLRFILPQAIGDVIIVDDPGGDTVRAALSTVLM